MGELSYTETAGGLEFIVGAHNNAHRPPEAPPMGRISTDRCLHAAAVRRERMGKGLFTYSPMYVLCKSL
jgi:hypothetical protein